MRFRKMYAAIIALFIVVGLAVGLSAQGNNGNPTILAAVRAIQDTLDGTVPTVGGLVTTVNGLVTTLNNFVRRGSTSPKLARISSGSPRVDQPSSTHTPVSCWVTMFTIFFCRM